MLTRQQKIFVEEYFVNKLTGAEAAVKAGYAKNKKIGNNAANRLLKSKTIKNYILSCQMHGIDLQNKRQNIIVNNSGRGGGTTEWKEEFPEQKQDLKAGVFISMSSKEELMDKVIDSYEKKIKQLEAIIEANIPKKGSLPEENKNFNFNAAISAISEHNKMMGHHAPTKSVNIDIKHDPEVRKMIDLSEKFLLDFKEESKDNDIY